MAGAFAGVDDWLFLSDDSNESRRQFTGEMEIGPEAIEAWQHLLRDGRDIALQTKAQYGVLIAPSKENVFPHLYPYKQAPVTVAQSFGGLAPALICDPTIALRNAQGICPYDKVDTHWNDWGAYIATKKLLDRFGLSCPELSPSDFHEVTNYHGDLGNKMRPPVAGSTWRHNSRRDRFQVFDNGVVNHGRIWIFERGDAPTPKNVVFFGDSFGVGIAGFLSQWFRRVVYIHATSLDLGIIFRERPDIIISEITDRFLPRAPESAATFSVEKQIRSKIAGMPFSAQQAELISKQREYFARFEL